MAKHATLYRMVTHEHLCPFGIKSKDLLERKGFDVEDFHLENRKEVEAFKARHEVKTTPQIFINSQRIGGYDDLVNYFGEPSLKQEGVTYQPIIAVFATSLLMSLAFTYALTGNLIFSAVIYYFIALSMCVLAILKLRDLYSFSNQFITYDLVAMRWVRYAYIYPFAEALAGIAMIAGVLTGLAALTALLIGTIGAISVAKAVYLDKRELRCACVGGDSKVPLGFVSLTENLMMVGMGLWMLF